MRPVISLFVLILAACNAEPMRIAPNVIHAQAHNGGSSVGFSASGALLASGGWEGSVAIWHLPDGKPLYRWQAHADSVNGVAFTDDDRHVVTAGYDGWLAEWALGGTALRRLQTAAPITCMAASTRGGRLITGHEDGSVRIWRLQDFTLLDERMPHHGKVRAVAVDDAAARYASSGADGSVFVWSGNNEKEMPLEKPPTDAWSLAFPPGGQLLYGGGWFRLFRWNIGEGALVSLPTEHHGIIKSIQFTPDGGELATISRQTDSAVLFLNPMTGAVTRRFQKHELCGAAIAVSPQGHLLATTSDDASVRIWRLERPDE